MSTGVASTSWLLQTMLPWSLAYKYLFEFLLSIPLSIYPEVELLDPMLILCLIFWGASILFPTAAVPFTFPPSSAQRFRFLHILTKSCCCPSFICIMAFLEGDCLVGLICFSLTQPNNVEHLFMCLLATRIPSLEKCLFTSFAHFLNWAVFLLLSCKSSVCILDARVLLDTWFANIFSHSMHCLSLS